MFACALNREHEHDKLAQKGAVDMVMRFLDPFTTRSNLLVRGPGQPGRGALQRWCHRFHVRFKSPELLLS